MKKTIRPYQTLLKARHMDRNNDKRIIVPTMLTADNKVHFYTQGGGFLYSLTVAEFNKEFKLMSDEDEARADKYYPAVAYWESGEHKGPGLTHHAWPCVANTSRWNGWAVPWFTKETIELLFKRQYLNKHGYPDLEGSALTPVFWYRDGEDYDKGVFWDNNIPDYVELCHMVHEGTDYYCIDGYCWDLVEPADRYSEMYTQQWSFVEDTDTTQTDEDLVIEGETWMRKVLNSASLSHAHTMTFSSLDTRGTELVGVMKGFRDFGDELSWQQRQYVLNWLHRWENCNDA